MKPNTIHHLNSALIIISCIVAFYVPFELFLFSYGVLGPLHYLTEIGWLHKKNYFTKGKYDFLFLGVACTLLVYWNFFPPRKSNLPVDIILFSLLSCIAFVFIKDWLYRFAVIVMALISVAFLNDLTEYYTWVGIFLPTIIHVFIFTWAFMLYGTLKEKSLVGLIPIAVLIICSILLVTMPAEGLLYQVSEYSRIAYGMFAELNFRLINFFNLDQLSEVSEVFTTKSGFIIMRFIAFAYTYHYLNWFSKTSVIKWHQVPRPMLIGTLLTWLLAVGIYAYDYNKGLQVLFFLSFLHVFLEFPLNIVSFTGIGKEIGGMVKGKV
jgi:hypothetical protein